jgi:hypothetical protein
MLGQLRKNQLACVHKHNTRENALRTVAAWLLEVEFETRIKHALYQKWKHWSAIPAWVARRRIHDFTLRMPQSERLLGRWCACVEEEGVLDSLCVCAPT